MTPEPQERGSLRALIADDAFAATFQTLGQYRTALLAALRGTREASGRDEEARRLLMLAYDPVNVGYGDQGLSEQIARYFDGMPLAPRGPTREQIEALRREPVAIDLFTAGFNAAIHDRFGPLRRTHGEERGRYRRQGDEMSESDHRNRVEVIYGPVTERLEERAPETLVERFLSLFGKRYHRTTEARFIVWAEDTDAIYRQGPRTMMVDIPSSDPTIRSKDEAQALADAILKDLANE